MGKDVRIIKKCGQSKISGINHEEIYTQCPICLIIVEDRRPMQKSVFNIKYVSFSVQWKKCFFTLINIELRSKRAEN
jgi:hypothetical protein